VAGRTEPPVAVKRRVRSVVGRGGRGMRYVPVDEDRAAEPVPSAVLVVRRVEVRVLVGAGGRGDR